MSIHYFIKCDIDNCKATASDALTGDRPEGWLFLYHEPHDARTVHFCPEHAKIIKITPRERGKIFVA